MAGKRQATSHLDHENWEQEDEPEERGTFKTAPPEELRARVIKKATRRQPATGATKDGDAVDSPRNSVFSGFPGFGKPATAVNAAGSPFEFLSKLPAVAAPATDADCFAKPSSSTDVKRTPPAKMFSLDANFRNDFKTNNANGGVASSTATTTTSTSIFGNTSAAAGGNSATKSPKTLVPMFKSSVVSVDQSATNSNPSRYSAEYPDEVGALNLAVVKFLQESLDKNQYCILTPVFDSYDKFLKKLQEKYDRKPSTTTMLASTVTVPTSSTAAAPPAASFKFGIPSTTAEKAAPSAPAENFSFGTPSISTSDKTASTSSPAAGFLFGKPSTTATSATEKAAPAVGFSFGISSTSTNTTEKASSSLSAAPAAPGGFSFLKPSTPISTTSVSDTASPSLIFDKKPNSTATTIGTTSTITSPLFSLGPVQTANVSPTKTEATSSTASGSSIFSLGAKSDSNKDQQPKPSFFFGVNNSGAPAASSTPKTNGFIFGLKSADDKPSTSGFTGFGKPDIAAGAFESAASTFSFGNVKPPTATEIQAAEKEAEEDSPPVVQFKQVVEDDAIFSKRCKVFVKKGGDYTDRGVGTLYLKPVKDTKKTQLLVRADTNLGNILVNLILSEGLPCQRMGKNNVMMVCLPTPEETKPLSMLLRVKTAEEADDVLEQIKKHTV